MARDDDRDDSSGALELPIDGVLDLHSFAPRDVGSVVAEYLDACLEVGLSEVRIIHVKGSGTLRRTVHSLLDRSECVVSYRLAGDRSGWGATLVVLRRRRRD